MISFPSANLSIDRLQQFRSQFSTTSGNMSETNNNFLLNEIFDVKGKVRLETPLHGSSFTNVSARLLSSPAAEVALD